MAAEVLLRAGRAVELFDAMPSVGRKFLLAGKGGLNLTHSEDFDLFVGRFGHSAPFWRERLRQFGAPQLQAWAHDLGIATFVGSSGRVFPQAMQAAPLLRAWLARLRALGLKIHTRHRLTGVTAELDPAARYRLHFATPRGLLDHQANTIVLALGGASWPQLGSDGAWVPWLRAAGVAIAPLRAANCGFDVARAANSGGLLAGWTEHFRSRYAGSPLKGVRLSWRDPDGALIDRLGEFVITESGVEGSLIYAAAAQIRDCIEQQGHSVIHLDLLAQRSLDFVQQTLAQPRGSRSLSTHLKSRLGLDGVRASLLYELLGREQLQQPLQLAASIKALPLRLQAARPLAEAISTAGGVRLDAMDSGLMLKSLPGIYCAGEMLDWEAPTGGYLLTACFASGRDAAKTILA